MKKLTTLFLSVLLALTLVLALTPNAYADVTGEEVNVQVNIWADNDNKFELPQTGPYNYGHTIEVDLTALLAEDGDFDGYAVLAWLFNGQEDPTKNSAVESFIATTDLVVDIVLVPTGQIVVGFQDVNGKILDVDFLAAAGPATYGGPSLANSKVGYEFTGWGGSSESLENVEAHTLFVAQYEFVSLTEVEITVDGGEPTTYAFNQVVTLENEDASHWEEDGKIVAYGTTYSFSALYDRDIVSHGDGTPTSLVTLAYVEAYRENYQTFLGQIFVHTGDLVEWGLLGSDENAEPEYGDADVTIIPSTLLHPVTNEFLRSIPDASAFDVVRAYAVIDTGEGFVTIYSDVLGEVEVPSLPQAQTPFGMVNVGPQINLGAQTPGPWRAYVYSGDTLVDTFNMPQAIFFFQTVGLPGGDYTARFQQVGNPGVTSDSELSGSVAFNIPFPPLAKPVLAIDAVEQLLTWGAVENATSYEVYVDDALQLGNTSPFDLSFVTEPGIYEIRVVAKASGYLNGEEVINYTIISDAAQPLDAPTGLNETDGVLTWNAVANAVEYVIHMNDDTRTTSSTTYDLANFFVTGTHNVTVVAVGDGIDFLDSDPSAPLEVTIAAALTPLATLDASHLAGAGGGLVNPHGANDHRNIVWHGGAGAAILTQSGNANGIRITVFASNGTTELGQITLLPSQGGTSWHIFGGGFGGTLQAGNIVHLQVVPSAAGIAAGYTYSLPYILTLN